MGEFEGSLLLQLIFKFCTIN